MTVIKKLLLIGLFIVLFFGNYSCSDKQSIKVGLLIPNIADDRFPKDRDNFIAAVKVLGGEVVARECQNDDKIQIKQAQELINEGVKVLAVISVNKNTAATIIREAHKNGVKVIAYDRIIANCDLDYFVSFDNVKVGELMTAGALKKKQGGNFVILGGDKSDQNAIWVRQGMYNVLDPLVKSGKVKIVYDVFIEDWSGDNAYFEMRRLFNLSSSIPDAIVSAYDGLTTGTIKALEENHVAVSDFPAMSGQNAELEACQNIIKGKQTMTVYKPLKALAEQVAAIAMKCAKGETMEKHKNEVFNGSVQVPAFFIEPLSVDASNMKSTIVADGFWKESEVYSEK